MYPLASQTNLSSLDISTAQPAFAPAIEIETGTIAGRAANDNVRGWKPTLLVQRRRRLKRRAGRV